MHVLMNIKQGLTNEPNDSPFNDLEKGGSPFVVVTYIFNLRHITVQMQVSRGTGNSAPVIDWISLLHESKIVSLNYPVINELVSRLTKRQFFNKAYYLSQGNTLGATQWLTATGNDRTKAKFLLTSYQQEHGTTSAYITSSDILRIFRLYKHTEQVYQEAVLGISTGIIPKRITTTVNVPLKI